MKTLIAEGAEARIYKDNNLIIKERVSKSYRIKELDDKLIKYRNRREISILEKASRIINVPKIIKTEDNKIFMEFIDGDKLSDILDSYSENKRNNTCKEIGRQLALLHNANLIHGDLTTSNMILKENKLYFIDFGLGFIDDNVEHKAVDLHLIKQALESKHYKIFKESFNFVLEGYKISKEYEKIIDRLDKVEKRGRYKSKK